MYVPCGNRGNRRRSVITTAAVGHDPVMYFPTRFGYRPQRQRRRAARGNSILFSRKHFIMNTYRNGPMVVGSHVRSTGIVMKNVVQRSLMFC